MIGQYLNRRMVVNLRDNLARERARTSNTMLRYAIGALETIVSWMVTILLLVTSIRPPWAFWRRQRPRRIDDDTDEDPRSVKDMPGPQALPILGTCWMYYCFSRHGIDQVHEAYKDMRRRFGPICKQESYWNIPIVSVFNRTDIENILRRNTKYPMRPAQDVLVHYRKTRTDRYSNLGLVNEQGETWHRLRNILTPELTGGRTIQGFVPPLNGVTDNFIDLLRNKRNARFAVSGFEDIAYRMGLETTCMLMLGKHLGFLRPTSESMITTRLANAVRGHFLATRDAFYGFPTWKMFTTRAYKNLTASEETIYDIISDLMDETMEENRKNANDEDIQAIFQSILKGTELQLKDKKAAIVDFIAAGIHTVGNTLVFLLHTMGRNPAVLAKLQEEADHLAPPNCDITLENLQGARYIRAFIEEVFRLLPTAPCIARVLDEPAKLSGYDVPEGTVVLLHTWIAGLEDRNFKNADQCKPERWLEPRLHQPHSPCLLAPFGFGRRVCPGKKFVNHALQLMIAKIVREFDVVADTELELQFEYLLAPKGPITLTFRDRVFGA